MESEEENLAKIILSFSKLTRFELCHFHGEFKNNLCLQTGDYM